MRKIGTSCNKSKSELLDFRASSAVNRAGVYASGNNLIAKRLRNHGFSGGVLWADHSSFLGAGSRMNASSKILASSAYDGGSGR